MGGVEVMAFADGPAFESWLAGNYTWQPGIWVKVAKKKSGIHALIPAVREARLAASRER